MNSTSTFKSGDRVTRRSGNTYCGTVQAVNALGLVVVLWDYQSIYSRAARVHPDLLTHAPEGAMTGLALANRDTEGA